MSDSVIRWEIDEVSKLTKEGKESPIKFIAGLPWYIFARKELSEETGNVADLSLYLYCNEESDNDLWSADTDFTLTIFNAESAKNEVSEYQYTFNSTDDEISYGTSNFVSFDTILDADEGFIKDDRIIVEARLSKIEVNGIMKPLEFDFSSPFVGTDKVALIIEGKKVYVSKNYLTIHSPVFAAMFNGDFAEKNKEEIELKDVSREEFIELLYVIYPSYRPITRYSVRFILALADFYQIKYASNLAETYLIKTEVFTTAAKLLLADKFKLNVLQKQCMSSFEDQKSIKLLEAEKEFKEFSLEMRSNLLTRVFEFIE